MDELQSKAFADTYYKRHHSSKKAITRIKNRINYGKEIFDSEPCTFGGLGSLVVKVKDSWQACHEFEPSAVEQRPCKRAVYSKSALIDSAQLPLVTKAHVSNKIPLNPLVHPLQTIWYGKEFQMAAPFFSDRTQRAVYCSRCNLASNESAVVIYRVAPGNLQSRPKTVFIR
ncbi:hypothetical protein TNCV_777811 [Trichonephila clavipes]|nr:hypothetical protein TNCV_777811 [Trichonephila clavipes]